MTDTSEADQEPPGPESIDPAWWGRLLDVADLREYEVVEHISRVFARRLTENGLEPLERAVLGALWGATSAVLKGGDWLDPFVPVVSVQGRRSFIPSDLNPEQITLLSMTVPLLVRSELRARIADVVWMYGDRSNTLMLDTAIDAYIATPLASEVWMRGGGQAWQRAFVLLHRRGPDGLDRLTAAADAVRDRVLTGTVEDRYFIAELSGFMRKNSRMDEETTRSIAAHLTGLAARVAPDARLARHLEREAKAWFSRIDDDAAHECAERVAATYVVEADQRVASEGDGATLAEGFFLEKAIASYRTLPRRYRLAHGIETLIPQLRERLRSSREDMIESMIRIKSDPIDISEAIADARAGVSGHANILDALAAFVSLAPPMDHERTRSFAEELISGSIRHIFGSSTLSTDGRKVASRPAAGTGPDEDVIWAEMVRNVTTTVQITAKGRILPALDVLTFDHRFSRDLLTELCLESPAVPEGHAHLWAAGLAMGFNLEFGPAIAILVPQMEHLIRVMLKEGGADTLYVDDDGVETEKSMSALLQMPEAAEVFGPGMVMEMKAMLVEQGGANQRHDIAHGLFDDAAGWTHDAVFMWWFCLRLATWPVLQMRREPGTAREEEPTAETDMAGHE